MNINQEGMPIYCHGIILVPMEILIIMVLEVVEENAVVLVAMVALVTLVVLVSIIVVTRGSGGKYSKLSLASQPLHKKGRVWYGAVTRVVLFPRNPGEYEYANFVAAA